jgi:DNA repair and recombination protein RAD54 and RAD54-like protein
MVLRQQPGTYVSIRGHVINFDASRRVDYLVLTLDTVCHLTVLGPFFIYLSLKPSSMLRRVPTTSDGKPIDRLQESTRINKPFKPPTPSVSIERIQPQRKRKRVSYKEQQDGEDDVDADGSVGKKRKKNDHDTSYHNEEELLRAVPKFPVYKPKPFGEVFGATRRFSMPSMRGKDGVIIPLIPTNVSLGVRPQTKIIPRPLHDPMEDHAIVLYDPTIDDRETDEEKKERQKEEEKERAAKEAREKTVGMYNPHKSLKEMLGEGKDKKHKVDKVPVVIDPRLAKVLRPHQVEGVKVSSIKYCS